MASTYRNARDVLPVRLLVEVQKHHEGLLWVPSGNAYRRSKRSLIEALIKRGVSTDKIAAVAELSRRRIQQIKQEMRRGRGPRK